ncbi:olfactory receptor 2W3-like [Choloepus didactylus]|uniref:olfactory receptor 2W3-like n=1 Tax=Choloepus didactylus TaxID=27675 RepID=UPI00189D829F|nr:olfactory receptor 2W3-like [Choloepus didactylus]
MGRDNSTSGGGFILVGFSEQPGLERILFVFILIFYLLTLMGNVTIILVSRLDPHLHTPMYFFLTHLSFIDLTLVTCISPQMLFNLRGPDKSISFVGCVIQLLITLGLGGTECVLLAMMAYDRYVAICQPLHYFTLMPPQLCWALASISWFLGFSNSLIHTPITMTLPRCGHHRINHFSCETPPMMQLACVDTTNYKKEIMILSSIILVFPLSLILVSYGRIARSVLTIQTSGGRQKALGTCGSHLTVVSIFYSTLIYVYVIPKAKLSHDVTKFLALLYNLIPPLMNPIIYTLRNRSVKEAIRNLVMQKPKAFGAHGSHLLVVLSFYASAIYTFLQLMHSDSERKGNFIALFCTVITPMLNPLIYTLRNADVKVLGKGSLGVGGLRRPIQWKMTTQLYQQEHIPDSDNFKRTLELLGRPKRFILKSDPMRGG